MINWSYFVNPTVNTGSEGAAILAPVTGVCREEESCLQLAESENVVFNVLLRGRSHTDVADLFTERCSLPFRCE